MPRRTNVHQLSKEDFDENILNYNTTPRKSLGWMTPLEVFNKNLGIIGVYLLFLQKNVFYIYVYSFKKAKNLLSWYCFEIIRC